MLAMRSTREVGRWAGGKLLVDRRAGGRCGSRGVKAARVCGCWLRLELKRARARGQERLGRQAQGGRSKRESLRATETARAARCEWRKGGVDANKRSAVQERKPGFSPVQQRATSSGDHPPRPKCRNCSLHSQYRLQRSKVGYTSKRDSIHTDCLPQIWVQSTEDESKEPTPSS